MKILAALFLITLVFGCSSERSNLDKTVEGISNIENAKALESCLQTAEEFLEQNSRLLKLVEEGTEEIEECTEGLASCASTLADAVESLYKCKGLPMPQTTML